MILKSIKQQGLIGIRAVKTLLFVLIFSYNSFSQDTPIAIFSENGDKVIHEDLHDAYDHYCFHNLEKNSTEKYLKKGDGIFLLDTKGARDSIQKHNRKYAFSDSQNFEAYLSDNNMNDTAQIIEEPKSQLTFQVRNRYTEKKFFKTFFRDTLELEVWELVVQYNGTAVDSVLMKGTNLEESPKDYLKKIFIYRNSEGNNVLIYGFFKTRFKTNKGRHLSLDKAWNIHATHKEDQ